MAGITCTEVLLSIGWTVASILIGIKIIMPISTQSWIFFGCVCTGLGPLFGVGIYFNKFKQTNRDAIKADLQTQNYTINNIRENIDILFTQKLLEQKNIIKLYEKKEIVEGELQA